MNIEEVTRMAKMEQKITDINGKLDNHIQEQREDFNKVFSKLDNLNNKFAGKWVEKLSMGILLALITALIGLILHGVL